MRFRGWFKSKPYWLRGGLIGVHLFIVSAALFTVCMAVCTATQEGVVSMVCYAAPSGLVGMAFWETVTGNPDLFIFKDTFYAIFAPDFIFRGSELGWDVATHITSLFIFFLTGTLIGCIIVFVRFVRNFVRGR